MSYIKTYGMTEDEYRAAMDEACDYFQACAEQQAQQLDCDFNMHTEGRDPDERDEDEGLEDDPQEGDDNADDFEPEDQFLDGYMEDRMSGMDW